MTDIVFVNPNNKNPSPTSAIEPPFWAGLCASYIHDTFKADVAIVDAEMENLTVEQTVHKVKAYDPSEVVIVVMGNNPSVSSTPKMSVTEQLQKYLPNAYLTGIHPIALNTPKTLRTAFSDTSTIPHYLFDYSKYTAHNWHCLSDIDNRSPYAVTYTSLNCPYDCYYCNVHTLYGDRKVRYRPLDDIYRDFSYFAEHGIKNIKIWDELFTFDKKRVWDICTYIVHNKYNFNIWCYGRLDSVDKFTLEWMKAAGINWIAYGFESVDDKKFVEHTEEVIKWTQDAGINIMANFMFGLDEYDSPLDIKTIDFALEHDFEYANFYVAKPYPGSKWYEDSIKNKEWNTYDQYSKVNINSNIRKLAFESFFYRPKYLSMIKHKFGDKAEQHIKDMLKWRPR